MSQSLKDQIQADLSQARSQGELRAERIKAIVQSALFQASTELKAGASEIAPVVREILSAVVEAFAEQKEVAQSEVEDAIAGAVEALETSRRSNISQTQDEIRRLEAQIEAEEAQLQTEIRASLDSIQESQQDQSSSIKSAIQSALDKLQNTEEMTLMRKRYAQLKSQLAVVQAYLVDRYGDRYGKEVTEYLEDAKIWYQRAKSEPAFFTEKVERRWQLFEEKLAQLGAAMARKERRDQRLLLELWRSLTEPLSIDG